MGQSQRFLGGPEGLQSFPCASRLGKVLDGGNDFQVAQFGENCRACSSD